MCALKSLSVGCRIIAIKRGVGCLLNGPVGRQHGVAVTTSGTSGRAKSARRPRPFAAYAARKRFFLCALRQVRLAPATRKDWSMYELRHSPKTVSLLPASTGPLMFLPGSRLSIHNRKSCLVNIRKGSSFKGRRQKSTLLLTLYPHSATTAVSARGGER
jgi:hypothetical protein